MPAALTTDVLKANVQAVRLAGGNRRVAATVLGIPLNTLVQRLDRARRAGIEVPAGTRGRKPKALAAAELDVTPPTPPPYVPAKPRLQYGRNMTAEESRDAWRQYVADGRTDDDLRNLLIECELPKIERLAYAMNRRVMGSIDVAAFVSVGVIACIDVAGRYDPLRASFWTIAGRRCAGAMLDEVRQVDSIGRSDRGRSKQRQTFERQYLQEHGSTPAPEVIQAALGWSHEALRSSYAPDTYSMETVAMTNNEGDADALFEMLSAVQDGPDAHLVTESSFRECCKTLPLDVQTMIYLYYVRETTMANIGVALGLSESRVSQQMKMAKQMILDQLEKQNAA